MEGDTLERKEVRKMPRKVISPKMRAAEELCKELINLIDNIEVIERTEYTEAELDRKKEIDDELRKGKLRTKGALRHLSAACQYGNDCKRKLKNQ